MKIARTVPAFPPEVSGPGNTAYEIAVRLEKRGYPQKILTWTQKNRDAIERVNDVDVMRAPVGRPQSYGASLSIPKFLHKYDYDLIHAHSYRNAFTDIGFLCAKLSGVPFVLHTHGTLLGYKYIQSDRSLLHRGHDAITFKKVAKNANAVIVSSEAEMREAVEFGIDRNVVHHIPEGKNPERWVSVPKIVAEDEFRVLFVGRIAPSRNVDLLIRALKYTNDDVRLRIVGDAVQLSGNRDWGGLNSLIELSETLGVESRVDIVGAKYGEELVKEYREADVFAYPSSYENFGQPLVEAAMSGLPVVSTATGIAPDIIRDGETGKLVPFGDTESIGKAIQEIRASDTVSMGHELQYIARKKFDWKKIVEEIEGLYKKLR